MVTLKPNPTGIDVPIQAAMSDLYDYILAAYGIPEEQYNCYGRAYRNQQAQPADGYVPEVFVGGNSNDYRDAYFDDTVLVTSFFSTPERTTYKAENGQLSANLSLIFCVNLGELYPGATRNDVEAQGVVMRFFDDRPAGFTLTELVTGIANVYSDYTGYRNKEEMKFRDMHPWHSFRLNLTLLYNINNCITNLFPN
jgi:hypothetical protein